MAALDFLRFFMAPPLTAATGGSEDEIRRSMMLTAGALAPAALKAGGYGAQGGGYPSQGGPGSMVGGAHSGGRNPMGIFDVLSSAPKKNPYAGMLSDEAWQYYQQMQRRKQIGSALRGVGDYLNRGAVGDYRVRPASGGGGQNDLMQMMKMHQLMEASQDRSAKRQREETQRADYKKLFQPPQGAVPAALAAGGGPTPQAATQLGRSAPVYGMLPDAEPRQIDILRNLGRDIGLPLMAKQAFKKPLPGFTLSPGQTRYGSQGRELASIPGIPKAPTSRSRIAGGQTINEEFDPTTNSWRQIGQGPRWDPRKGGPTAAQQASNREITQARKRLTELEGKLKPGSTLAEELHLRMSQKTPTGRSAPDYNSYWGRTGWLAAQSLTGKDDPGQAYWSQRLMGVDARARPSASEAGGFAGSPEVGPAVLPPTDPARSGALPPSAFAPPTAAPARTPPPTERELRRRSAPAPTGQQRLAAKPGVGETVTIEGKSFEVLGRSPDGTLTVLDLETGKQYFAQ